MVNNHSCAHSLYHSWCSPSAYPQLSSCFANSILLHMKMSPRSWYPFLCHKSLCSNSQTALELTVPNTLVSLANSAHLLFIPFLDCMWTYWTAMPGGTKSALCTIVNTLAIKHLHSSKPLRQIFHPGTLLWFLLLISCIIWSFATSFWDKSSNFPHVKKGFICDLLCSKCYNLLFYYSPISPVTPFRPSSSPGSTYLLLTFLPSMSLSTTFYLWPVIFQNLFQPAFDPSSLLWQSFYL